MRLGDYTFKFDPEQMTPIQRTKAASSRETYEAAVLFEWPSLLLGAPIILTWDMMPTEQYEQLNNKFQAGGNYEFNPAIGAGTVSYFVDILDFTGDYEKVILDDFDYRRNVRLELMITTPGSTTTTTTTSSTTTTTTA